MKEYIFANEGSPYDEAVLGDADVYESISAAEQYFEHWVSEEPNMRFYTVRGERLIAVDHGDLKRTFHFENTGSFFEGFDDLVRREAERRKINLPEAGFSVEYALNAIWEQNQKFEQENQGCLAWFMPSRRFREKHGFWAWWLPFLRREPKEE